MAEFNPSSYLNDFDPVEYLADEELPTGDLGDAIIEPLKAIGGALGTEIAAGYAGMAQSVNHWADNGAGAQMVEDVRSAAPDFSPQTQAGQDSMELIRAAVEKGVDITNMSIAGLEGIADLVRGRGIDKAVETVNDIRGQGISANLGDRALEATNSPLAATAANILPEALLAASGFPAKAATIETAQTIGRGLREASRPVVQTGREIVEGAGNFQTPTRTQMARDIQTGSNDPALAEYEVASTSPRMEGRDTEGGVPRTGMAKYFDPEAPKLVKSPAAKKAINQGWDPGVVQPMKNASRSDKNLASQMLDMADTITKDKLYGMKNRPSDVAGDKLMSWLEVVRKANRAAGQDVKPQAERLKGKSIDVAGVGGSFSSALDDMGITLKRNTDTGNIEPNYLDSDIEGLPAITGKLTSIINRIDRVAGTGKVDAYAFHQLKSFIDEHVTFGKAGEGLSGKSAKILKDLRYDLNEALGDQFPAYAKANKTYSETIKSLDAFQDVAGRKMNLIGPNADKSTGTLMRRLMGNAQSRITLMDAIEDIKLTVDKHGGYGGPLKIEGLGGDLNDLDTLVMFADEVDRVIGVAPPTSIQGVFDRSIAPLITSPKAGALDMAVGLGEKVIDKIKSVNPENAIKTMKELLREKN